ncbi:GDP-D-glucose phosphorylase 1 [Pseudolycoriella hygida]|uniref:GDP-D-glucose phosphorylase 1 n=1 Tax=Pseudolycoriella hygida TaxID=35572 RepID=A0A9Q0MU82_9DIPT|nr:GDP-D-glucose phosphorylase 1 [Pseudolycoriella hygida]
MRNVSNECHNNNNLCLNSKAFLMSLEIVELLILEEVNAIEEKIKQRWTSIEEVENVFRYKLNVEKRKIIPGKFRFFVEFNPDRTTLRRKPQTITSIVPTFNESEFNFNKINQKEILFNVKLRHSEAPVTFLINNSPLTKYHTLLVPRLNENLPQLLTRESIAFAIELLHSLNDNYFRIGYNSPGAFASVNHLHFHLMYIEQRLFIDDVEFYRLVKHIYRITDKYPSKGYCFLLTESTSDKDEIINDIAKLIEYFCAASLSHNIYCTKEDSKDGNGSVVKIFVFPRANIQGIKEFSSFNVAFCELSGYIPIGDIETFHQITENSIVGKIDITCGNIANEIENDVIRLYSDK